MIVTETDRAMEDLDFVHALDDSEPAAPFLISQALEVGWPAISPDSPRNFDHLPIRLLKKCLQ
jgi:hypothetical protein